MFVSCVLFNVEIVSKQLRFHQIRLEIAQKIAPGDKCAALFSTLN